MRRRDWTAVLLACALPAAASTIGSDIPLANFTDRDQAIFRKTLDDALDKGADGATLKWSNPESKAYGEVKPLKTFERGGSPCRTVTIVNHAKGRSASNPFTFCKAEGTWKLVPANPAKGAKTEPAKKP